MMIREANIDDLPVILEIMNDIILHSTAMYEYNTKDASFINDWFRQKQEEGMPVFVCELDGQTIGYGTYGKFRPRPAYQYSVEHSIYIHKNFRGQGFGTPLMHAIINSARARNYHVLIAGIDASNTGSIAFHKKFGFVEVAHFKEVGYKFDRWLDLVFMQLFL